MEEEKANEADHPMSLDDCVDLFQKLANSQYIQQAEAFHIQRIPSVKIADMINNQEKLKGEGLELEVDKSEMKEYLVKRELLELDWLAGRCKEFSEQKILLDKFNFVMKENSRLAELMQNNTKLIPILKPNDYFLLDIIVNKLGHEATFFVSSWLYEEYNLYIILNKTIYLKRYKEIVKAFLNLVEQDIMNKLSFTIEDWNSFICTLPLLTKRVFQNISAMCIKENTRHCLRPELNNPLQLLKSLAINLIYKESIGDKALKELLQLSSWAENNVGINVISIFPYEICLKNKYYKTMIEYAIKSFEKLKEFTGDEDDVEVQAGLLFKIAEKDKFALISIIKIFPEMKESMKLFILEHLREILEEFWGPDKDEMIEIINAIQIESVPIIKLYVTIHENKEISNNFSH